jgi:hypothetical protein
LKLGGCPRRLRSFTRLLSGDGVLDSRQWIETSYSQQYRKPRDCGCREEAYDGGHRAHIYELRADHDDRRQKNQADETRGIISGTDLLGHFNAGSLRHDIDVGFEYSQEKERLAETTL